MEVIPMSITVKSLQKSIFSHSYPIKLQQETQGFLSGLAQLMLAPLPAASLVQSVDMDTKESFPVLKWNFWAKAFCFKGNKMET